MGASVANALGGVNFLLRAFLRNDASETWLWSAAGGMFSRAHDFSAEKTSVLGPSPAGALKNIPPAADPSEFM